MDAGRASRTSNGIPCRLSLLARPVFFLAVSSAKQLPCAEVERAPAMGLEALVVELIARRLPDPWQAIATELIIVVGIRARAHRFAARHRRLFAASLGRAHPSVENATARRDGVAIGHRPTTRKERQREPASRKTNSHRQSPPYGATRATAAPIRRHASTHWSGSVQPTRSSAMAIAILIRALPAVGTSSPSRPNRRTPPSSAPARVPSSWESRASTSSASPRIE